MNACLICKVQLSSQAMRRNRNGGANPSNSSKGEWKEERKESGRIVISPDKIKSSFFLIFINALTVNHILKVTNYQ